VGPIKAMQILQTPVEDFVRMAAERDAQRLAKLPGVGKKTAERILLDLSDRLGALGSAKGASGERPAPPRGPGAVREDLVSALVNLGYREARAEEAADAALAGGSDERPIDELVRAALGALRPARGKE